jgi:hypothetical protein
MNRTVFVLAIGFFLTASGVMAAQVTNVELGYQDGSAVVRIDVQGPVRFTHATEVPKEGRPDRVIVDILSATHELGAKEFLDLPACVVTGIRSSQYSVSPEKIVRVVLDISQSPMYRVESDDHSITIYIEDKTATPFPVWSSSAVTGRGETNAVVQPEPAPSEPKSAAVETPVTTVAEKNEQIENDRQQSLAGDVPSEPVQSVPVLAAEPEPVPTPAPAVVTPVPVRKPAPSVKELAAAFGSPSWRAGARGATEAPTPAPKPVITAPPVLAVTEPAAPEETDKSAVETTSWQTASSLLISQAPNVALAGQDQPTVVEPPKPEAQPLPVVTAETQSQISETLAVNPNQPSGESTPAPAGAGESTQVATAPTPEAGADSAKPVPADFLPALPESDEAQMASDGSTDKSSTARFRRSASTSLKAKGTMVAEFPQRLVIKYESDMFRDPFATLLDDERTYNSPVEQRIPNVEGLKLVGVLESANAANRALFEDKEGYSYILKSGDKVRSGYVLRVEADCVYFQIFEYGWSRTVALTME